MIACCGHSDPESDARVFRREMRAIVVSNYQTHPKEGYEACFVNPPAPVRQTRATRFTFTLTSTASLNPASAGPAHPRRREEDHIHLLARFGRTITQAE